MTNYRNQDPYGSRRQGDRRDQDRENPRNYDRESPYAYDRGTVYDRARANAHERMRRDGRAPEREADRMRHSSRAAMNADGYDRPARTRDRRPEAGAGSAQRGGNQSARTSYQAQADPRNARPVRQDVRSRDPRAERAGLRTERADRAENRTARYATERRNEARRPEAPARTREQHRTAAPEQRAQETRERNAFGTQQGSREEVRRYSDPADRRRVRQQRNDAADAADRESMHGEEAPRAGRIRRGMAGNAAETASAAVEKTAAAASAATKKAGSAAASIGKGGASVAAAASSLGSKIAAWAKKNEFEEKPKPAQDRKEAAPKADTATNGGNEFGLSEKAGEELAVWHNMASKAFGIILTVGMVLGLLIFMRPAVSQSENRELTKFPQFNVADFVSGAYTEGISTWYADTYPFRDRLIAVNQAFKGLYGFESDTQMFGGATQADDIPDEAAKKSEKKDPVAPETYDSFNLEEDIQGQIMQGLYVDKGSVYATYGFTQEAADDYVNALNGAADKLEGTTQVYSILIPNNSGILLSKDELAALGGSNQGQAIQYYYDSYNDKVKTVPTMKPLLDHKDEYLYFRTDHHWTSLAAYYVYKEFCSQKGIEPHNIEDYEEKDFAPFLGSYYSQLQLESLTNDPDTVQAWIPKGTNDLKYTDVDGNTIDWNVIKDVSDWDQGTQYNCFVGGDQPWAEIHNPQITDGSSCLVVKESYGNAFIPWLVDHYENVYIVDFRYNNNNVVDICKEKGVNDLIFLNNISIIGSVDVAGKIQSLL